MPSPLTESLIEQLVRIGVLDADDVDDMARRLDADGYTDDSRIARAAFVKAVAPNQSEWEAGQRRSRMQIVPDGGNREG